MPFEEDDKDPTIWFLDHSYLENMFRMFKKVNGERLLARAVVMAGRPAVPVQFFSTLNSVLLPAPACLPSPRAVQPASASSAGTTPARGCGRRTWTSTSC